jgi:perosamine synthetase
MNVRTLPPAAAPVGWSELWRGLAGLIEPQRRLRAIEAEIRLHFGVEHVFLVSSGTAALTLTLLALKSASSRRDVIIPAYTCFSIPAAVLKAGLRPVLCDVNPRTFDFDHGQLEETLSADTLCVVAHHLFGIPSAIERIRAMCVPRRIVVLEDAAQAMGGEHEGRRLGTLGDVGIFSLGRGKNITCGSGGVIITRSTEIADAVEWQCRQLVPPRLHEAVADLVKVALMALFIRPRLYWIPAALPFLRLGQTIFPSQIALRPLSGMKAGLLHNWRSRLAESNKMRSATATYFGRQVPLSLLQEPSPPYVRLPMVVPSTREKDRLFAVSQARGLGLSVAYPSPISDLPELKGICDGKHFPAARELAATLVTLPTHHWVSKTDRRAIAALCRAVHQA